AMRHPYFLFAVFLTTGCVQPPTSLALQCVSGSAQWHPLTLDFASLSVGGHPAVITDDAVNWQTITRNGFGGATQTHYGLDRNSSTVRTENTYTDPKGNRAVEPKNG